MNLLRKLLFPFAILYGFITSIRNFLFDRGILKSTSFNIPVIAVGNLSVGGTGKTPQIEYLIRLLSDKYQIATLSRGYKRKSEGFVLADKNSNAEILGDEPFQFYQKFPFVMVAVDANRTNGIRQLLSQQITPEIILLDDAYQHRKVKAGFYILLTSYDDLYSDDFMLPTGNLRESRNGANRAKIVIVTKCPKDLSDEKQAEIRLKLNLSCSQQSFFTFIDYDDEIYSKEEKIEINQIKSESKLILAGIAKPKPFFDYLKNENDECLTFPDHHHFSDADLDSIQEKAKGRKIITTEKDYVRLKDSKLVSQLYYLPIKSTFINHQQNFDATILEYVKTNLEA
ncbi:lipid-A-disaccharide kinase [Flavobacterium resistens]|uniref:Tetraacyldisaccharide 4'-kinase n=1 Tax=Flavobacterium resistens TaxID=443612 RepID=A0A521EPI5_9FLAO|nr:tetraacyldisaccharide 4'-kinase [Flavobacterium resistens]MRX67822.1 tetraacyldisaccharide 4'-kinase [Flavobacterium resistens]SMO85824.1 lipid-A-disaccharide kinase [Flavobacterium resistens]